MLTVYKELSASEMIDAKAQTLHQLGFVLPYKDTESCTSDVGAV